MKKEDKEYMIWVISVILSIIIIISCMLCVRKDHYYFIHSINDYTCYQVKSNNYRARDFYYRIRLENGSYMYLEKEKYYSYYGKSCPFCNE